MNLIRAWVREIRPHQWAKNLLLFMPAMAGHVGLTRTRVSELVLGFAAFSLLASSVYVVNDLVDLPNDREHATKRHRPVAAGLISPAGALAGAVVLIGLAVGAAWSLPRHFQIVLLIYLALTTAYSFVLKRRVMMDVIALASLYTIRVVAGSTLADAPLSQWFLAFSIFFFFSLAIVKRVAELRPMIGAGETAVAGRGYVASDLPTLTALGIGASTASSLVYCLYITSAEVTLLYQHANLLWIGLPLFLYWQGRVWMLTSRGRMNEDPVVFALHDRMSYLIAAGFMLTVWVAT
ncbi:MAG: UbiA family prenyltransferase [Gemmatimonadales bacterium]